MTAIRVAIVGAGKIAKDRHIPAISGADGIELAAIVDPNGSIDGIAHFATLDELLAAKHPIDAVALCTPPQTRLALTAFRDVRLSSLKERTLIRRNADVRDGHS